MVYAPLGLGLTLLLSVLSCSSQPTTGGGTASTSSGGGNASGAGSSASAGSTTVPSLGGAEPTSGGGATSGGSAAQPECEQQCAGIGHCVNEVCTIEQNDGDLTPAVRTGLTAGGAGDAVFAFLYPYDRTVFARGVLAPTLQFSGGDSEATFVHISTKTFDFKGFYGPSSPPRVALPQAVWEVLARTLPAGQSVKVQATQLQGGAVTGPIEQTWTIASGTLRGAIYYETVASSLLNGDIGVMRIRPGERAPTPLRAGCGNACHSASADGSTLVASGEGVSTTGFGTSFELSSTSFQLGSDATILSSNTDMKFTYGGLYPNGSFLMSSTHYRLWPGEPSRLYDTKTRENIAASGWDGVVQDAGIPAFSPDGRKIAFNHEDTGGGHSVAMMDFDVGTKTFSNLVDLAQDPSGFVGWPGFTPDNRRVIYHVGSNAAFETGGGADLSLPRDTGALFWVDVATKRVQALDAANGVHAGNTYVPTVLPIAVGGYFWVMYTSHRDYGNTLTGDAARGKLWVSALDMDPAEGADPSHPGFFLDGQELAAVNLRGFWALEPCRAAGVGCEAGDQCCDGFCREADGALVCTPPPPGGCANESESCTTRDDCCDPSQRCINRRCSLPPPR